jgi:beta-lactamase superfamily II metal-dependent hydrolase
MNWRRALTALFVSLLLPGEVLAQELAVHFMNVGQGDGTLIVCPNGNRILVDAGSAGGGDAQAVRSYFLANLDAVNPSLNTLVITHPDTDHYNFLDDLLSGVTVGNIFRVGVESDYSTWFWTWLGNFRADHGTVLDHDYFDPEGTPNPNIDCGSADIYVLAASIQASDSRKNALSIVLLVSFEFFDVILTGDATFDTEAAILARYSDGWLDSEVLKIGHHGSETTSTGDLWLQTIQPQTAVASAGFTNSHQHPRRSVIRRVDDYTIDVVPHRFRYGWRTLGVRRYWTTNQYREAIFHTGTNGNILIQSDGNSYSIALNQ